MVPFVSQDRQYSATCRLVEYINTYFRICTQLIHIVFSPSFTLLRDVFVLLSNESADEIWGDRIVAWMWDEDNAGTR